jgi:hypothetical protein
MCEVHKNYVSRRRIHTRVMEIMSHFDVGGGEEDQR